MKRGRLQKALPPALHLIPIDRLHLRTFAFVRVPESPTPGRTTEPRNYEPKTEIITPPAVMRTPPTITGILGAWSNLTFAMTWAQRKNSTT